MLQVPLDISAPKYHPIIQTHHSEIESTCFVPADIALKSKNKATNNRYVVSRLTQNAINILKGGLEEVCRIPHTLGRASLDSLKEGFTVTNTLAGVCLATHVLTNLTEALIDYGALNISKILKGQVWRIATYPILHGNALHVTLNTLNLFGLGPLFEEKWRARGFAKIAALSITAHVLAKAVFADYSLSVGLSGIEYGMIGSLHAVETREEGLQAGLELFFHALAYEVIFGVIFTKIGMQFRIDYLAHLSGYVAGFAFGWLSKTKAI